jgi:hypothetical protein
MIIGGIHRQVHLNLEDLDQPDIVLINPCRKPLLLSGPLWLLSS